MKQILLVEPGYRNKYPPLGLMKIARYHKLLGDNVVFVKGKSPFVLIDRWDRVYISTLFSFFWNETMRTIKYYRKCAHNPKDVVVGGVMASILKNELKAIFPDITVISGLLNKRNMLDRDNDLVIDTLVPDYTILEQTSYKYPINDAYIAYTTRGCVNKCKFCAVPKIEPIYKHYIPLKETIALIESEIGPKNDLMLLDNNVLASRKLRPIIKDIIDLGFYKGAKLNLRQRKVDFNQGLDLRLLDEPKIALLSETALRPLRIAFDNIKYKEAYIKAVELAAKYNILHLSNYILFNYDDTPKDFYDRLKINLEMNNRLGTKIYSFPMKYIPITDKVRRYYVGPHWTWKMIRGVQCILNATGGVVGTRIQFFEKAFGNSPEEFMKIINMPERYILFRLKYELDGGREWSELYDSLTPFDQKIFINIIASDRFDNIAFTGKLAIDSLLKHYLDNE